MKTLITVILVLTCLITVSTENTENEKVLTKSDLTKEKTKNYEITKKDDTFLENTKITNKKIKNTSNHSKRISRVNPIEIEGKIREVLEDEGVKPFVIELIVAQSKHESGNYKNSLTEYNNIFARHYFKADTFAISAGAPGEGHTRFAKYPSVKSATLSQLWYFKRKGYSMNWSSTYQFAAECKRKGYYEAPLSVYVNALNKYMP